ncbi:MAG: hypothetical protein R2856_26540 [Caldilineaceae bacterium]
MIAQDMLLLACDPGRPGRHRLTGRRYLPSARCLHRHTSIEPTPAPTPAPSNGDRPLANYINEDLTVPVVFATDQWRASTKRFAAIVEKDGYLLPFYLQHSFSDSALWPYDTANPPGVPTAAYNGYGNTYWHDPGELLYTLALAYPYLGADLKQQTRSHWPKPWMVSTSGESALERSKPRLAAQRHAADNTPFFPRSDQRLAAARCVYVGVLCRLALVTKYR